MLNELDRTLLLLPAVFLDGYGMQNMADTVRQSVHRIDMLERALQEIADDTNEGTGPLRDIARNALEEFTGA